MLERFRKACEQGNTSELDILLSAEPDLITQEIPDSLKELAFMASQEQFSALDYVLNHKAFTKHRINIKCDLLRDIVDTLDDLAQKLRQDNKSLNPELVQRLKAIYEKSVLYNSKIIDKSDIDYLLLGDHYFQLSRLAKVNTEDAFVKKQVLQARQENLEEAIFWLLKVKQKGEDEHYNYAVVCNERAHLAVERQDFKLALQFWKNAKQQLNQINDQYEDKARLASVVESNFIKCSDIVLYQEARHWGCQVMKMKEDGGDGFLSVLQDQLSRIPNQDDKPLLTQAEYDSLRKESKEELATICMDFSDEFNAYILKLIQEGIWSQVDAVHRVLISRKLKMNLLFVRSDNVPAIIIRQLKASHTLMMGIKPNKEYVSLRQDANLVSRRSIEVYLYCVPADYSPKRNVNATRVPTIAKTSSMGFLKFQATAPRSSTPVSSVPQGIVMPTARVPNFFVPVSNSINSNVSANTPLRREILREEGKDELRHKSSYRKKGSNPGESPQL